VLALCLLPAIAQAAPTPYVATVVTASAEVRCKPSAKAEMYVTNRLLQGARVLVLEERADGWLGIQPPPGSFSWVSAQSVARIVPTQCNFAVQSDNVPVLIGSDFLAERPTVEGVRLVRGTQVRVIGAQHLDGDTAWLPIDPPPGELRYVRAEAVAMAAPLPSAASPAVAAAPVGRAAQALPERPVPAQTYTTASPGGTVGANATLNIPVPTASNAPAPPANATPWQKADYYERQGRYEDAARTYEQLAQDLKRDYPKWSDFAAKRADYLRKGGRTPANLPQSTADTRYSTFQPAAPVSAPAPEQPPQVRLAAPPDPTAAAAGPAQTSSWSSPQVNNDGLFPSGVGQLARSGRTVNGLPTYRLEVNGGAWYITPAKGVDLEPFVNQNVECFGTAQYSGELRANYMVVSRVQPM
jgi:hypothetical protein